MSTDSLKVEAVRFCGVKSCQMQLALNRTEVYLNGIVGDREFMIVDPDGNMITQRQEPRLARVMVEYYGTGRYTLVAVPGQTPFDIPNYSSQTPCNVDIWSDSDVMALDQGDVPAERFSKFLGRSCRLVKISHYCRRSGQATKFQDSAPLLLVSQASIDLLSQKLGRQIESGRFRENILVSGCTHPHQEDEWDTIKIGDNVTLKNVGLCPRCEMADIRQGKGARDKGVFARLHEYRPLNKKNRPFFGAFYKVLETGHIASGDQILIK